MTSRSRRLGQFRLDGFGRIATIALCWAIALCGFASAAPDTAMNPSIPDAGSGWPSWQQWRRVLLLQDYNTRIVVFGVAVLGAGAGLVGSFTLLRKRALMGDALSHASLPGIAVAFIIATVMGLDGKSLVFLLTGATISGLLGVAAILWIRNQTRLKEDAALGIVLSVFFGAGVSLLGVIQNMESGSAAGLESFIYGKTASMRSIDTQLISLASITAIIVCVLLFKELKLLCFDEDFAGSRGFRIVLLDVILMTTVVLITQVGLQAVGLILMIALMVIPAAASRFWTEKLSYMAVFSMVLGVSGCVAGAIVSAVFPRIPSGAMIVLVCSMFFFFSMMLGTSRGVLIRGFRRRMLNRRIERQHLLRAMYEISESAAKQAGQPSTQSLPREFVATKRLLQMRSWSKGRLAKAIRRAEEDELVQSKSSEVRLTRAGFIEAARLTRQHRMWEMYLIAHAEVAPALVDRDADAIEHVLEPEVIDQLEELLEERQMMIHVPESPHEMTEGN